MTQIKSMMKKSFGLITRILTTKQYANIVFANNLPMSVKKFVQNNFPNMSIALAENCGTNYGLNLNDGTEIEIGKTGNWSMINCRQKFPMWLIPITARKFIENNFSDCSVIKAYRSQNGYEIMLSDMKVMKFDKLGILA